MLTAILENPGGYGRVVRRTERGASGAAHASADVLKIVRET